VINQPPATWGPGSVQVPRFVVAVLMLPHAVSGRDVLAIFGLLGYLERCCWLAPPSHWCLHFRNAWFWL